MVAIGAHLSTAKGFDKAALDAEGIGADAMQVFTRNPRGGKARALGEKELANVQAFCGNGMKIVCHAPYTINLASSKEDVRDFGVRTLAEDLKRMDRLGAECLVVHSGAHTGAGKKQGLERLVDSLEKLVTEVPKGRRILLETMSGSGTELGSTLEELAEVFQRLGQPETLGLCLDTCHLFAAGYDVRDWRQFKEQFCTYFSWQVVGCIHMNDSKTPFFSHKDRHERLGQGTLGWETFTAIVQEERARALPLIMETPNDLAGWAKEIAELRKVL